MHGSGRGGLKMAQIARVVLVNAVHDKASRGNDRSRIFTALPKKQYLHRFCLVAAEKKELDRGYSLMDSHVRSMLTPAAVTGLLNLFQRAHTWWALTFSGERGRKARLLQTQFHSSPLSEDQYGTALRYMELTPRRPRSASRGRKTPSLP